MCQGDLVTEHPETDGIDYPHCCSAVPNINAKTLHPNHHGNSTSHSGSINFSPDGSYRESDAMVLKYEGQQTGAAGSLASLQCWIKSFAPLPLLQMP